MTWHDSGKESVPDSKNRIGLGSSIQPPPGVRYKVMYNEAGQILLDPVKTVPAREAWIWENEERIASVRRGIEQAEAGKLKTIDLSHYGNDDDEVGEG